VEGGVLVGDAGSTCARTSDCPAPLLCIANTCALACVTDRDCPVDQRCSQNVCATPSLAPTLVPTAATLAPGAFLGVRVAVMRGGLTDPLTIAVSGLPAHVPAAPLVLLGEHAMGSFVLDVGSDAPPGVYTLDVSVVGSGRAGSVPFTLTIAGPGAPDATVP